MYVRCKVSFYLSFYHVNTSVKLGGRVSQSARLPSFFLYLTSFGDGGLSDNAEPAKAGDGKVADIFLPSLPERDKSSLFVTGEEAKVRGGIQASDPDVILFSSPILLLLIYTER
jgi:hypothetical protein